MSGKVLVIVPLDYVDEDAIIKAAEVVEGDRDLPLEVGELFRKYGIVGLYGDVYGEGSGKVFVAGYKSIGDLLRDIASVAIYEPDPMREMFIDSIEVYEGREAERKVAELENAGLLLSKFSY